MDCQEWWWLYDAKRDTPVKRYAGTLNEKDLQELEEWTDNPPEAPIDRIEKKEANL